MTKFKQTHPKYFPFLVRIMHPNQARIAKQIEDVYDRYGKQKGTNSPFSVNIED